MMYALIFLVSCSIVGVFCKDTTYTTRYDDIDLDQILVNDRLLTGYVNCLLDQGPCTADGKELKKNLPDAIDNDCGKCSEKQRIGSEKVMHYIIDHRPEDWDALEKKYNSDGSYKKKYMLKKKYEEEHGEITNNKQTDEEDENREENYNKNDD